MPRYRYKVVCYVEIDARDEYDAEERLDERFKDVDDIDEIDLRCVFNDEPDWDAINDDRRLGIGRFEDD